jgi:CDP-diacylglycerol--glycerol-3-phosphate 3-phosphatidyltransferase
MIAAKELRQLIKKTPIYTVANVLTVVRLLLLAPIFFFVRREGGTAQFVTFVLVGVGWLTDALDGYMARKLGQISELGKILDPLVDKIFVISLFFFLMFMRDFPAWVLIVIIPRDLLILWGGFYLARKRKTVEQSQLWGKLAASAQIITAIAYLLRWQTIAPILLGLALFMVAISTWSYGRLFFCRLREVS